MTEKLGHLDAIRKVRADNNDLWMKIVEIALVASPVETKAVLRQINFNDTTISHLLKDVAQ